jgi:hypothetical protein
MRHVTRLVAGAALIAALSAPASAQGFLKRLVDRAIDKVEQTAEQKAAEVAGKLEQAGQGAAGMSNKSPLTKAEVAAPEVMTPRAVKGGGTRGAAPAVTPTSASATQKVKYPSRISPPSRFATTKAAYDQFGKVRCSSCEGGYAFDGWPKFPRDELSGKYNEFGLRLGAMAPGQVHRWTGVEASGSVTVVREEAVEGLRCRHLRYTLSKSGASAERPGLVCWGYGNEYAASENWHEVY